ncbi:MAG: ABC-F family ATP-binding cassette domain-containing protein [Armatimonadota bacterium]
MALVSLSGVRKSFGAFQALDEVSFTVGNSEKVALVGPNGTGKTTILRLITRQDTADSGQVSILPDTTIGYVRQDSELEGVETLLDAVSNASGEIKRLEAEMHRVERALNAEGASDMDALVGEYGVLQHEFERLGGYSYDSEVKATLTGLGLGPEHWEKPVGVLSGGQKTRAGIAKLLLQKPSLLLLDEPTNHLDIDATEWLEDFLQGFPGAVLVVSHDRYFLDKVVTKVVDLHDRITRSYPGNYSSFMKQREEYLTQKQDAFERQQEEIQKLETFINRYRANQKSKQSRGRQKFLNRMERVDRVRDDAKMGLKIDPLKHSSRDVITLERVGKSFGENSLFRDFSLMVEAHDRVGLVGPNGAGKTTLLKIILSEEPPTTGTVTLGYGVDVGYFAQDLATYTPENTVLDELLEAGDFLAAEARNILAQFLFKGDDVYKEMSALSGGERNRVALAKLMVARPNLLVLDEPTNHLDIDSRDALGVALSQYDGTIILTSHDRYLLNSLTTKTVEIANGQARLFDGNYDFFINRVRALKPKGPKKTKAKPTPQRSVSGKKRGPSPEKIEREIVVAEARLSEINELLSLPETYADHELSATHLSEHGQLESKLAELYQQWEEAAMSATT